ncbi:MAG: hypothetical protein D6689_20960 [Deltaproteobacteria bacterium]|nr:MAG: hypothetical protein D6689_20960 [Deltaproteobacteria bacterium]
MDAHDAAITLSAAAAAGVFLIAVADRLRVPSIALLLVGGVALGPQALGWIDPATLGAGLETVVALAVAVVLFEGGLTLDVAGFRREPTVIVRMLTVGVLVTWAGAAATLYLLYPDLGAELSIIAGSLVIVTGPTVVSPLLRRIGVRPRLHHILYWEGVLVDAVGVFVAVLCFEWIASAGDQPALAPLGRFASRFAIGAGIGAAVGLATGYALRKRWVAADHTNIAVLAAALLALALANAVLPEAGILAVIAAGLVVGVRRPPQLKELKRFKLELTEVGIGLLFVLLAARLDLRQFLDAGWRLVAALAVLLLVLRPIGIALSTWGQHFSWRERAFLAWMAPRGIVAASMASLFALRLDALGYERAGFLETFTYAVIGTTVIVQGLSAPAIASWLGVKRRTRGAWLLVGDPHVAVELHRRLRQAGGRSLVLAAGGPPGDALASDDVDALADGPFDPAAIDDPRIADVEAVLALARAPEINDRICEAWSEVVGAAACYRWDGHPADGRPGRAVWTDLPSPAEVKALVEDGRCAIDAVDVGEPEDAARFGPSLRPLLAVDDGHIVLLDGDVPEGAPAVVALRRRIPGLAGLVRDAIVIDRHAPTRAEVIGALLDLAARHAPDLPRDRHAADILAREEAMPTAIGAGAAVPHVYDDHCPQSMCFVANVAGGLDWHGPDGEPVRLVFLVVSPAGQAAEHLRSLAAISHLVSSPGVATVLARQRTRGRLLALLRELE